MPCGNEGNSKSKAWHTPNAEQTLQKALTQELHEFVCWNQRKITQRINHCNLLQSVLCVVGIL